MSRNKKDVTRATITLDSAIYNELETTRKSIPRSIYINEVLRKHFENTKKDADLNNDKVWKV